ncbi:MAG: hypothetical protein JF616_05275 [Fibrobacteres bacterium]|nr:hypothetical protein [Fibrobacterota bacterium]
MLGLLALVVYLKFDSVARLPFWKTFRHPGEWISTRMRQRTPASAPSPVDLDWAHDSSHVNAVCPVAPSQCLGTGFPLGPEPAGQVREILGKAEAQWQARAGTGFAAGFARSQDLASSEPRWELERLELRGEAKPMVLEKDPSRGGAAFCVNGRCLDDIHPHPPIASFRSMRVKNLPTPSFDPGFPAGASPEALFSAANGTGVLPVLPGRIVAVPAEGDTAGWLKLHHGRNLFSYYRGFARMGTSVRPGAMLEPGDTLGWIGGDSAAVELRIESGGMALDPLAFLGLPARAEENVHGR